MFEKSFNKNNIKNPLKQAASAFIRYRSLTRKFFELKCKIIRPQKNNNLISKCVNFLNQFETFKEPFEQ